MQQRLMQCLLMNGAVGYMYSHSAQVLQQVRIELYVFQS